MLLPIFFFIIWFSNLSTLGLPDECYYRNESCALNLISTFLFLVICVYLRIHNLHITWCSCHLTVTQRGSLLERELLTILAHLNSPWAFIRVLVVQSLVLYAVFSVIVCPFFFGYCIFSFWLPLWYLQTFCTWRQYCSVPENLSLIMEW